MLLAVEPAQMPPPLAAHAKVVESVDVVALGLGIECLRLSILLAPVNHQDIHY